MAVIKCLRLSINTDAKAAQKRKLLTFTFFKSCEFYSKLWAQSSTPIAFA